MGMFVEMLVDVAWGAIFALLVLIAAMACSVFIGVIIKVLGGFFGIY